MTTQMYLRSDLQGRWLRSESILSPGEIAVAVKEHSGEIELKIGDGVHPYRNLPVMNMANIPDDTYLYYRISDTRSAQIGVNFIRPELRSEWEDTTLDVSTDGVEELL